MEDDMVLFATDSLEVSLHWEPYATVNWQPVSEGIGNNASDQLPTASATSFKA
jgi:hypothetical protein